MGLDAVVYKSRERFPVDPAGLGLRMEPDTREWYSDNGYLPDAIKIAGVEALHRCLGNVSSIAELHREAARVLRPQSLILCRVLYDGSHCGDFIGFERMTELKEEIELLRRSEPLTQIMASFLDDLDQLVAEAEEQRNPVVFV
jgi:hypothetical protein